MVMIFFYGITHSSSIPHLPHIPNPNILSFRRKNNNRHKRSTIKKQKDHYPKNLEINYKTKKNQNHFND